MDPIWDELHKKKPWGRYPAEDLIRTVMRNYKTQTSRTNCKVLELGCGAGANLSFFLNEDFQVYGVDGSFHAIEKAKSFLKPKQNQTLELHVSTFENLQYQKNNFNLIVDYFALYANRIDVVKKVYSELNDLLETNGWFYGRVWGTRSEGFQTGTQIEVGTSENPETGPCANMGVSHFFTRGELDDLVKGWKYSEITRFETEYDNGQIVEEFSIWGQP